MGILRRNACWIQAPSVTGGRWVMQIPRIGFWSIALILSGLGATVMRSDSGVPVGSRILRLDPDSGRPGDIISAYGEQLDESKVEALFLSDGECTALVSIAQQNQEMIRFRIPAMLPSGRYRRVIQPVGRHSHGIEQQVTLRVLIAAQ